MSTRSTHVTAVGAAITGVEALRHEELERTRQFIRIGWGLAVAAAIAVLLLPGQRTLAHALLAAMGVTTLASVWVAATLRPGEVFRSTPMVLLAIACAGCGVLAVLYSGFFAGAPLLIALGLYFFCRTESRGAAVALTALVGGSQAVIAALVISGAITDPGFAPLRPGVSIHAQLAGQGCALFAYGMAFWLARSSRAASLRAVEELQRATKLAATRAAQVDELRDDLDRALDVGGHGRFSGAVVGCWELGDILGRGGMGEVYDAVHVDDGRIAAVKLLRRELMIDRSHVERFLREVRAASALDSPHVVRVLDAASPDDLVAFLAMEKLDGETLGRVLRGGGALDPAMVLELATQLGSVLELARTAGVVHRDIKPHNVFRTQAGVWKLLDFGVAALGDSAGTLTQGGVIGTPGYMAPEQAKGEAVDHTADLYALGALVYRCLTGRIPFTGRDLPTVMYTMVHEMPIRPSALVPLPAEVDHVLAIALAKQRADRFQRPRDLVTALAAALGGAIEPASRAQAAALLAARPWREDQGATRRRAR